jgi:hypothetical protein
VNQQVRFAVRGGIASVSVAWTTSDRGLSFDHLLLRFARTSRLAAYIRTDRTVCVFHLDPGSTSLRAAEAVRISSRANGKIIDLQSIENVVYEKSP